MAGGVVVLVRAVRCRWTGRGYAHATQVAALNIQQFNTPMNTPRPKKFKIKNTTAGRSSEQGPDAVPAPPAGAAHHTSPHVRATLSYA